MFRKSLTVSLIGAAFFAQAQDVTTIKNAGEVYGGTVTGTSRYNSMAGATGALGGDISSLNNNPAGIGVAITSEIAGTLIVQGNKNSSKLFGNTSDYTSNHADIGQIGGIAAFALNDKTPWKFVNLGINFSSRSIESYIESSGNNDIIFNLGTDAVGFSRHAYDRTGSMSKMSVGVGANYDNRIYIGAGLNLHSVHLDQSDTAEMIYESNSYKNSFAKQYTPYSEESNGISASLGLIGKVNNMFRLGAAVETPTFWNIDRTYNYYDAVNSSADGTYSEIRKFQAPLKATLSAALVPTKNIAVNLDYTIGITKPKFSTGNADLNSELKDFYNGYKNQSEIKVGAEYRVNGFRLRGGYGYATNPFDTFSINTLAASNIKSTQSYNNLFGGTRNTIGAGLGYDFKSFYIDAAYQNVNSTYSNPFLKGSAEAGTQYYSHDAFFANDAAVVSLVKNTQNNFSITLGWKF